MPLVKHTIIYLATIVYTSAQHTYTVIQILVYVEISHSLFEKLRFNFHIFGNFSFNSPTAHTCRTQCDLIFFFFFFFLCCWTVDFTTNSFICVCVFVYPYSMLCDQKVVHRTEQELLFVLFDNNLLVHANVFWTCSLYCRLQFVVYFSNISVYFKYISIYFSNISIYFSTISLNFSIF